MPFRHDGKYCGHRDEIALESPLGPVLANRLLAKLDCGSLRNVIPNVDLYLGYMGDSQSSNFCYRVQGITVCSRLRIRLPNCTVVLEAVGSRLSIREEQPYRKERISVMRLVGAILVLYFSCVPVRYEKNLISCLQCKARTISCSETLDKDLE